MALPKRRIAVLVTSHAVFRALCRSIAQGDIVRILFVGLPESIHTVRWIEQINDHGWDVHFFPVTAAALHPAFKNITVYRMSSARASGLDPSVRIRGLWPLGKGASRLTGMVDSAAWLARIIRWLKPDIIHSLGIQTGGYLTLEAKVLLKHRFPTWMVANWGSDLYLFGRLAEHTERITAVLAACDYFNTECCRDVDLARAFGFRGEALPGPSVTGGLDVERARQLRQPGPTSARRLITLKGYQHFAGRALVGLRAIELCADALTGYQIAVYLASLEVRIAAELLSQTIGLQIECIPHSSHEEMLRLHGRARISIGLSISDGFSVSLMEAMTMGSFPIQSHSGCEEEWLRDGETGLLVHPEDPEGVASAIRRAVADDALVDRAAESNGQVVAERLDHAVVRPQVVAMYNRVLAQTGGAAVTSGGE